MEYKVGDMILCKKNCYYETFLTFEKGKYYMIGVVNLPNDYPEGEYDLMIINNKYDIYGFDVFKYNCEDLTEEQIMFKEYFCTKEEERKLKIEKINGI